MSKSPKSESKPQKPSEGLLIADLRALASKHGADAISRDFYRANNSIRPTKDAWSGVFNGFPEFRKAAGLDVAATIKPEELTAEHRVEILREKEVTKRENRKDELKTLLRINEELGAKLAALTALHEMTPQTFNIEAYPGSDESQSCAVLMCSDWHNEEKVDINKVNGLNEYNLDIFAKRANNLFVRAARMWEISNRDTAVDTMVVWLGGDFISGNIHPDIVENNALGVNAAIMNAYEKIVAGLRYLLEHTDVKKFLVPCHSGNHGRFTPDQRIATEAQNSIEYTMYMFLVQAFKDEPRIEFIVSEGYFSYLTLWDSYTMRLHHGHAMRGGSNIGGITIPINKRINEWNKSRIKVNDKFIPPVNLDIFGHFHQYINYGNFVCNGSLIGYNPFALNIAAAYEPPVQAFFLINKRWNSKTMSTPIFVD